MKPLKSARVTKKTKEPAKPKLGRPPRAGAPTVQVTVRVTLDERARYTEAAEAAGTTLAESARAAWEALAKNKR